MKKSWYSIVLVNDADGYSEVIAKVKSKGLAYSVLVLIKATYLKTQYAVIMK